MLLVQKNEQKWICLQLNGFNYWYVEFVCDAHPSISVSFLQKEQQEPLAAPSFLFQWNIMAGRFGLYTYIYIYISTHVKAPETTCSHSPQYKCCNNSLKSCTTLGTLFKEKIKSRTIIHCIDIHQNVRKWPPLLVANMNPIESYSPQNFWATQWPNGGNVAQKMVLQGNHRFHAIFFSNHIS